MRTTTHRAAVLVAAGALGLGGVVAAAPALAGVGPFANPSVAASVPGPGWSGGGMGSGYGMGGSGMMGTGARVGTCLDLAITAERGTLSEQQKTTLAAMAQEEKLAHDLYTAFAGSYGADGVPGSMNTSSVRAAAGRASGRTRSRGDGGQRGANA